MLRYFGPGEQSLQWRHLLGTIEFLTGNSAHELGIWLGHRFIISRRAQTLLFEAKDDAYPQGGSPR